MEYWNNFMDFFTIFWFWIGVVFNFIIVCSAVYWIVCKIEKRLKKAKHIVIKSKIDYDYANDPDYYGE